MFVQIDPRLRSQSLFLEESISEPLLSPFRYVDSWSRGGTAFCDNHLASAVRAVDLISSAEASSLRNSCLQYLKDSLHGDELASEFVMLAILSRVYARHGSESIGSLNLNICGLVENDTCAQNLYEALSQFCPRCVQVGTI